MRLDIGIEGLREIEKWLPFENESTARERLRQLAQDRDDAWRLATEMETAIQRVLDEAPYLDGPERELLRAALPAREEGAETNE